MKKMHWFVSPLIVLISISSYATEKNLSGKISFSVGGGYEFFSHHRPLTNTGVGLLTLGYGLTDQIGIEGSAGFFASQLDNEPSKREKGNLFFVDGVYHLYPHGFDPFILGGIGVMSVNTHRHEAHNQGNVNIGAGVNLFVDPAVSFRIEVRDSYALVGGKNDALVNGAVTYYFNATH